MTLSFVSGENFHQLFAVVSDAAAGAAESETGADDDREADLAGKFEAVFEIVNERGFRHVKADALHSVFEKETVFSLLNGADLGADQAHVVFLEHAAVGEFNGQVERSLTAHGRKHGESGARRHSPLNANDLFEILESQRLDVSAIRQLRVRHDGCRIRVRKDDFKAIGLQRLAGLRAGVIELGRLSDDDRARAQDVSSFGHLVWHYC